MLTIENAGALIEGSRKGNKIMPKKEIKMIRNTFIDGVFKKQGSKCEVNEKDAVYLMRIGKAVPAGDQKKDKPDKGDQTK
jgi:hypothetical protein